MHQIRFLTFQFLQNILKSTAPGAFSWGRSSRGKRFILNEMPAKRMSNEFDSLAANEKAALKSALIRCRALVGRIESALCNEKPEHFLDELTLADFYAALERATDILGTVKGSQARGHQRHR